MKTIAEINRGIHDGETSPMVLIDDFFDHVRRDNFEALFAQLDPKLQAHIVEFAKLNVHGLDEGIEHLRATGEHQRLGVWCALKEWTAAQPWYQEAKAQARPIEWTDAQSEAWMASIYAETLLDRARAFQRLAEKQGQPDAGAWKPVVEELEAKAKSLAEYVEKNVPVRRGS